VNHSVFYQDLNSNFLKKKLSRDQRKNLNSNISRTTEANDPTEIDAMPEEKVKEENNDEHIVKSHQGNNNNISSNTGSSANVPVIPNISNGVKDKDKHASNKNLKEREKQRNEGNRVEKQENLNKNKGKVENNQAVNNKQNVNQQKNKPQQQPSKQNIANDSSADESKKI